MTLLMAPLGARVKDEEPETSTGSGAHHELAGDQSSPTEANSQAESRHDARERSWHVHVSDHPQAPGHPACDKHRDSGGEWSAHRSLRLNKTGKAIV